jgi:hypothetical protein
MTGSSVSVGCDDATIGANAVPTQSRAYVVTYESTRSLRWGSTQPGRGKWHV